MSIKYYNQKPEGFEHVSLEEFLILQKMRKQKVEDMEKEKVYRRQKVREGKI